MESERSFEPDLTEDENSRGYEPGFDPGTGPGPDSDPDKREVFRISRAQAMSTRVDGLLKRQMSLLGQQGVTRDTTRLWYYQSWFIFSLVAGLMALATWAIIEPYFNDLDYLQGTVQSVDVNMPMPSKFRVGQYEYTPKSSGKGFITIKNQQIWLLDHTRVLGQGGSKVALDPTNIERGQEIGVYVDYEYKVALAEYVVVSPRAQSAVAAQLTLEQLHSRSIAAGWLLFPLLGSLIGFGIGSADGIVCRLARRALLGGAVGAVVGFIGSMLSILLASIIYAPLSRLALSQQGANGLTALGFLILMLGRGIAWALAGTSMGLGQGIALRSKRLLLHGLLGGVIGGSLGGLLFDPIYFFVSGADSPSAWASRLIGLLVIGISVGAMIGVVELLTRDAWLRMVAGPLAGKEFILFKDMMRVGSSPRSDIYLFNDSAVCDTHATIRTVGDDAELESANSFIPAQVNGRNIQRVRLRHGDQIAIGRTVFVYEKRQG